MPDVSNFVSHTFLFQFLQEIGRLHCEPDFTAPSFAQHTQTVTQIAAAISQDADTKCCCSSPGAVAADVNFEPLMFVRTGKHPCSARGSNPRHAGHKEPTVMEKRTCRFSGSRIRLLGCRLSPSSHKYDIDSKTSQPCCSQFWRHSRLLAKVSRHFQSRNVAGQDSKASVRLLWSAASTSVT